MSFPFPISILLGGCHSQLPRRIVSPFRWLLSVGAAWGRGRGAVGRGPLTQGLLRPARGCGRSRPLLGCGSGGLSGLPGVSRLTPPRLPLRPRPGLCEVTALVARDRRAECLLFLGPQPLWSFPPPTPPGGSAGWRGGCRGSRTCQGPPAGSSHSPSALRVPSSLGACSHLRVSP